MLASLELISVVVLRFSGSCIDILSSFHVHGFESALIGSFEGLGGKYVLRRIVGEHFSFVQQNNSATTGGQQIRFMRDQNDRDSGMLV